MDRRELLKLVAILTGGTVIGGEVFLTGCKSDGKVAGTTLSEENVPFLNEVSETILPATNTPGAKEANVGAFMVVFVNDCYEEADRKAFIEGMNSLDDACDNMHKKKFMDATPEQRTQLLTSIDKEATDYQKKKSEHDRKQNEEAERAKAQGVKDFKRIPMTNHYFTMMKQLTLTGFFTSQVGMTKALRFEPVPGRWDACIDYKKGDRMIVNLDGNT